MRHSVTARLVHIIRRLWVLGVLSSPLSIAAPPSSFEWNVPVLDYPYNRDAATAWPSMQQSLHLTKDFYQVVHRELQDRLTGHPTAAVVTTIAFDVLSTWLPLGEAWQHEEWHRAVMGNRDMRSYNGIYDFDWFSETIPVSHVDDEDLVHLKQEHPQDLVRLHAAGFEAQNELNFLLEQDMFFLNTRTFDAAVLWLNYANNWGYIDTCASREADRITQDILREEGPDVSERDFTGLDCTAWVYDLFRPSEPYEARGTHPSGVGIDRYIQWSDLTAQEQDYLDRQARLSLVNFVNPFLFAQRRFAMKNPWSGDDLYWNATLRHHLTSFGYNLDANVFVQSQQSSVLLIWHQYFNHDESFPGIEARVLRRIWMAGGKALPISARVALWQQPRNGAFRTTQADNGGLAAVKIAYPFTRQWQGYIEVEAKTAGWVAGNVYLDDNVSARLGVTLLSR